jgi:hypothetical protein
MKEDHIVLRFPDGWDLASSYPDNLRGRLEKDAKPRRKAKKKPGRVVVVKLKPKPESAQRDDDIQAAG